MGLEKLIFRTTPASKKIMLHALDACFGAKNFIDNDHVHVDCVLCENRHHQKERLEDRNWRKARSYDAAIQSSATISDNATEK